MRARNSGALLGIPSTSRRGWFRRPGIVTFVAAFLLTGIPVAAGWNDPALAAPKSLTIAALGDSYSSGEGNPPFDQLDPRCRRSNAAWPHLLGTMKPAIRLDLFAACSGATTDALHDSFKNDPPQLTQLRDLDTPPDVVTITIGGNDAGFSNVIASCFAWKCFWTGNDKIERNLITKILPDVLSANYEAVKAASPHSRIVVVGYPDVFPSSQRKNTCKWLDSKERRQLTSLNDQFNRVIKKAAKDAGVDFVATDRALRGHEMCTKDSWVAPISLLPPGRDLSAHPTARGQQAIAKVVQKYLYDDR